MYILYTSPDGKDAVFITELQYMTLLGNLRYTHAVARSSRFLNCFLKKDLNNWTNTQVDFEDLPGPVKALIVLYEM